MSVTELIHFDKNGSVAGDSPLRRFFLALVIILVALLSFGIGRLTGSGEREGIKIEYDPSLSAFMTPETPVDKAQTASVINAISQTGGVVASQNGSKYHYSHCPGAKQIKAENKITFQSASEAEASGYTLAGNCQPH